VTRVFLGGKGEAERLFQIVQIVGKKGNSNSVWGGLRDFRGLLDGGGGKRPNNNVHSIHCGGRVGEKHEILLRHL